MVFAARNGHARVVDRLLAAGAKPNKADLNGLTPLATAADNGYVRVVDSLLRAGAEPDLAPNRRDRDTPLVFAAARGHGTVIDR